MRNKIISWGRRLANTFVRKGTNRRIVITTGSKYGSEHKATVFVAYTKDGELQVHVNRETILTAGESGLADSIKAWRRVLKVNLDEDRSDRVTVTDPKIANRKGA